jgi:galactose mutarotase-like enzyme
MQEQQRSWVRLRSADLTAEIDPLGAQLSALRDSHARDLLWDGDPQVWAGRAPLLFPIVGMLVDGAYRWGSKDYRLPRHGFARGKLFSIERAAAASAVFRLTADEETLRVYPFHFELEVHFELLGPTLSVNTQIRNQGPGEMPASFGYHPAFRWPLPFGQPRSSHFVLFEADEPAPFRRIDSAGLLTPERWPTPIAQRRLALTDAMFEEDVLIFDQVKSRYVIYGGASGPRIQIAFPNTPYFGLWSKPGAGFVCLEPWHGITDPQGFSGDFAQKPGAFVLQAGEAHSAEMVITLLES